MTGTVTIATPVCGCMGCSEPAEAMIDHPEHGTRTVCADHADGYEVIADV